MPLRIFVVDDHPVMVDAYTAVLGYEPDLETGGVARSGEEAIQMLTAPTLVSTVISTAISSWPITACRA